MVDYAPQTPRTIKDTGLDAGFLLELMIKNAYRLAHQTATEMAGELRLVQPIIEQLIATAREERLIQTLGVRSGSMAADMRYELTDIGRAFALDALRQSEYVGPAPVPLDVFTRQAEKQSIRNETITREMMAHALKNMTLSEEIAHAVGPAANSAASMLLYGPPGNGKTSIADAICKAFREVIFVPYAIEFDRQVITMFDNAVHQPVKVENQSDGLRRTIGFDKRYVVCKRPVVVTGGELTLDQLDLRHNPVSQVYEAPLQLKSAGGVFVIDDFGRQREQPQALINRWIVPLERRIDYLTLATGRKFEAPFDTLVIFSTNIPPKQLVDDAALRRIRHKIEVGRPDRDDFIRILLKACSDRKMPMTEDAIAYLLKDLYALERADFAAFHAGFLIDQVEAIAAYEGAPREMSPEFLRRAWGNLFTSA